MDEQLVNHGFGASYFFGFGYANCEFSSESKNPEKVVERIREAVKQTKQTGIDRESFERTRRKLYGRLVMEFNEVEDLASNLVDAHLDGGTLFDRINIVRTLTLEDVNERLSHILDDEYTALSVILPMDGKDE